jgi:very-short-patch-repair endonuclease
MGNKSANADRLIACQAAQQHGVISSGQLHGAGVLRAGATKRVQAGRLHRVHRGVYAVGHSNLSQEGRWMAAVLAGGEGAVLSHRSAAALWKLLDLTAGSIEISVPTLSGRRRRAGIRIHRRASLGPESVTRRRDIPVTTVAQTIADLSGAVSAAEMRRAVRQAEVQGFRTGLEAGGRTRSELEHLFLRLCRRHRLPTPEVNVRVGTRIVDFLWREQLVVVETDGYRFHRGAQAFEDDHDRDLELRSLGYDIVRLTYRQVTTAPDLAISAVADSLQIRP